MKLIGKKLFKLVLGAAKYEENGSLKFYPNDDNMSTNPFANYEQRDRFNVTQTFNATLNAKITLPWDCL